MLIGPAAMLVACAGMAPSEFSDNASTAPQPNATTRRAPENRRQSQESRSGALQATTAPRTGAERDLVRVAPIDYAAIPKASDLESKAAPDVHVKIRASMIGMHDGFVLSTSVDASLAAEVLLPAGKIFTFGHAKTTVRSPCVRRATSAAPAFGFRTSTWREDSVAFAWYDGRLDESACEITLTERARAAATALIRGLVYAARVRAPHTDEESLWLVMPQADFIATAPVMDVDGDAPFTKIVLPGRRGNTTSVTARFQAWAAAKWLSHTSPDAFGNSDDNSGVVLTLDVAWPMDGEVPEASVTVGGPGSGRISDPKLL